jgi:valyl-tRNA synthetase
MAMERKILLLLQVKKKPLKKLNSQSDKQYNLDDLVQDEDVMDTWFSSWIWPIAVFDGFSNDKKELDYYYPYKRFSYSPRNNVFLGCKNDYIWL